MKQPTNLHEHYFGTLNHSFNVGHAERYGLPEAVMISCFQYWITKNRANGRHLHDGRTWTYNSVAAMAKQFPYFKPGQIRRALQSLIDQSVLLTGNYNTNGYDRTLWYAFCDECIFVEPQIHFQKTANRGVKNDRPIPVDNTSNDQFVLKSEIEKIGGKTGKRLSTPEFIDKLRPLYPNLDLDEQLRNMQAWLLTPRGAGRKLTQTFVVNWLSRQDAPIKNLRNEPRTT